ncbi:MAG TPA: hypothetical protein VG056_02825, partial [Pirellulales bacterium]|nr:hypothetical protein [Pirellulales bacterium]
MPRRKPSVATDAIAAALSRRALLAGAAGLTAAASGLTGIGSALAASAADSDFKIANGRINQSVIHWCFKPMPVETLAAGAARLELKSVELVPPTDWPTLKK